MAMFVEYLQAKIHMAVVTDANPDYHGSITLDQDLLDAAHVEPFQKILVANATNGSRLETYVIPGDRGSGVIALNGAAALLGKPGDKVIAMTFCMLSAEEAREHRPRIVLVSEGNRPSVLVPQ
jgi:aspartate 1-decarboxylase